ncbi:MAG: hypothetical protein HOE90_00115 [Bacteriovoracaceae bacterium]|jgi:hypothetical protein|nr:hypothetical protein [Bacteriovoracaceae bacterium]
MKIYGHFLLVCILFSQQISYAKSGGDMVGNGGGGLRIKNGVTTFSSEYFNQHTSEIRPAKLPGLRIALKGVKKLGLPHHIKTRLTTALFANSPKRKYYRVSSDIPPANIGDCYKDIYKEALAISGLKNSEDEIIVFASTIGSETFLYPSFFQLSEISQGAILFHEALWVVRPDKNTCQKGKSTRLYKSVISAEIEFKGFLQKIEQREEEAKAKIEGDYESDHAHLLMKKMRTQKYKRFSAKLSLIRAEKLRHLKNARYYHVSLINWIKEILPYDESLGLVSAIADHNTHKNLPTLSSIIGPDGVEELKDYATLLSPVSSHSLMEQVLDSEKKPLPLTIELSNISNNVYIGLTRKSKFSHKSVSIDYFQCKDSAPLRFSLRPNMSIKSGVYTFLAPVTTRCIKNRNRLKKDKYFLAIYLVKHK